MIMFMGTTWGPSGADRTQVGPTLALWTLLSGSAFLPTCRPYDLSVPVNVIHLPISLRVVPLMLKQSSDSPSVSELILKDVGKSGWPYTQTKHRIILFKLQWRHMSVDDDSNHPQRDWLFSFLGFFFNLAIKKIDKLRIIGFCSGNSPGPCGYSTRGLTNAENMSMSVCSYERFPKYDYNRSRRGTQR